MMATRPAPSQAAQVQERLQPKPVGGIPANELEEEREPLLDLVDAAASRRDAAPHSTFDIPPPPPLTATQALFTLKRFECSFSSLTPPAPSRYQTQDSSAAYSNLGVSSFGASSTASFSTSAVASVRDYSSLYAPSQLEEDPVIYRGLYPAVAGPTAPSAMETASAPASAMWMSMPAAAGTTAAAAPAAQAAAAAPEWSAASSAVAAANSDASAATSQQVVEELLAENERLRLLVEEYEQQNREAGAAMRLSQQAAAAVSPYPGAAAPRAVLQSAGAVTRQQGLLQQQQRQQRQQRQAAWQQAIRGVNAPAAESASAGTVTSRQPAAAAVGMAARAPATAIKHVRCQCMQFLQVPAHAELVYCPTCGHTSRATAENSFQPP
ncbi:unnamed protein product, partial [Phaeothamnion confervicola]